MKKIRNREIRGVVFDMDGLMFDSERIVKLSWDVAGEELGYGKLGDNIHDFKYLSCLIIINKGVLTVLTKRVISKHTLIFIISKDYLYASVQLGLL